MNWRSSKLVRQQADAQDEYFSQLHDGETTKQYATKFISDPGKQNGLYWKSPEGQPQSPLGPLAAYATAEGYAAKPDAHTAFHGYYFRMLKAQGDKAPGGAKNYVVDGKMTRRIRLGCLPCGIRQLRGDDLHHQPGWSAAPKGFGENHDRNGNRNERVQSRCQLEARRAITGSSDPRTRVTRCA